jgi:hypothetical protein
MNLLSMHFFEYPGFASTAQIEYSPGKILMAGFSGEDKWFLIQLYEFLSVHPTELRVYFLDTHLWCTQDGLLEEGGSRWRICGLMGTVGGDSRHVSETIQPHARGHEAMHENTVRSAVTGR